MNTTTSAPKMSRNGNKHPGTMFTNAIFLFIFLAISFPSSSSHVTVTPTATSLRAQSYQSTELYTNSTGIISFPNEGRNDGLSRKSCSALTTCGDCTSTYTCHWCKRSETCHARGSIHGCAWGDTCKDVKPPKKENNTCASQTTCSDCALASHFCHWCEHDNACHAVGSRFGCAIGVDCYSNDRCRRSEPEPFPLPSSPLQAVIEALNRVPAMSVTVILIIGIVLFGCLCCCFCFVSNIKGAYDDLAQITIASVAPMSVIGDVHFTRLGEYSDEAVLTEEGNEPENDCETSNDDENNNSNVNAENVDEAPSEEPPQTSQQIDEVRPSTAEAQNSNNEQQQQTTEEQDSPYVLMDGTMHNLTNRHQLHNRGHENGPLLHPSFNGTAMEFEEPRHMKRLYRFCSALYYLSVLILAFVVGTSLFFYPKAPVYSVCNDEVAWTGIMKNIVAFKFDASFEILASLSNANRLAIALDRGKGSFSFDGKQFGTYEIPPVTGDPMTITDFMIIVHISPADKTQAIQLAESYYMGKLILDAEFEGRIRFPALFDFSRDINVNNIVVDINAASDRSLCQCPTWDDGKNHSAVSLP